MDQSAHFSQDFWQELRQYTPARIALGHAGSSVPTRELLAFQLAHARARDAVHAQLDIPALENQLRRFALSLLRLRSQATTRHTYLQRPDWGRRLDEASRKILAEYAAPPNDISLVIADGLSALAIEKNIEPVFSELIPALTRASYRLAPLTIVEGGRVAIGDEIGQLLNSQLVIIFIGERPGLSSPDSLGIYLTYGPAVGLTDERRNCISNVRPEGLPYAFAAGKLMYLVEESLRRKLSGVPLKDETDLRLLEE
jgi:ethanolamine ammonia-lyase small subunit